MMRIITGKARGVRLETLEGLATRPTAERAKEALFNTLQFELSGKRVLDLFSGSGQIGLEALSRGAQSAVMCDNSAEAVKIIRKNIEKTRLDGALVLQCDYMAALDRLAGQKFDIIFLDPPYAARLIDRALSAIIQKDMIAEGGMIVCEDEREAPYEAEGFSLRKHGKYGRIYLSFLEKEGEHE